MLVFCSSFRGAKKPLFKQNISWNSLVNWECESLWDRRFHMANCVNLKIAIVNYSTIFHNFVFGIDLFHLQRAVARVAVVVVVVAAAGAAAVDAQNQNHMLNIQRYRCHQAAAVVVVVAVAAVVHVKFAFVTQ